MTVLERPGEERARAAPSPRAPRGTGRSRRRRARASTPPIASSSTWTPFCSISFPKYTTVGSSPARNSASRSALPSSGSRSFALPGFGGSRRASAIRPRAPRRAAAERELVDVDAGRHLVARGRRGRRRPRAPRGCAPSRRTSPRPRERLPPPALELRPAAHRVLELGAVRLDAKRRAGRGADRPAHQHMVREHEVGGQQLAERRGVRVDVGALLGVGEVLQELRLEAGVAVHHEDRQQPARQLDVTTCAPPRSYCSGARSWQTTMTSWPARLHSRASARV